MMRRHNLPPLTALRAFEAVARLSSFKAAAAELLVTSTAISHQIRQLEAYLAMRLLDRGPGGVRLTPAGRELFDATASGFAEIARATARLRATDTPPILTLTATTVFLSHWLVPRLSQLHDALPDLELRLHASDQVVDLSPGGVDLAIRYGQGPSPGASSHHLVDDAFAPVCSPGLGVTSLGDLVRAPLIHIDGRVVPQPSPDWPRWCSVANVCQVDTRAGIRFTDSLHAVQAAIAGQGVAIASLVLAADALASGVLVRPFAETLAGGAYHFVAAAGLEDRADVVALRKWFQSMLAG